MLFSKAFLRRVSQLVISSFLYLNIHTTAVLARDFEVWVTPHPSSFLEDHPQIQEILQGKTPENREVSSLFSEIFQTFQPKTSETPSLEGPQNSMLSLLSLLSIAWTVRMVQYEADVEQTLVEQVFTPFAKLQAWLLQSLDELKKSLEKPLKLEDFIDDTIEFKAEGWKADIAWNGGLKLTRTDDQKRQIRVQSLTEVILDHVTADQVQISAPYVKLNGKADINHLILDFNDKSLPDFETNTIQTGMFELTSKAQLTLQTLEMNGLLWNKGVIDLKDPAFLKVQSLESYPRYSRRSKASIKKGTKGFSHATPTIPHISFFASNKTGLIYHGTQPRFHRFAPPLSSSF